jgi:hypothetical protein
MPPFVVEERHIDALITALDEIFSRGLDTTIVQFVIGNLKQMFVRTG